MQKLIVIVGPTGSGKSALAVKIAQQFGGEVISADSRQIYRGLTIGAGTIIRYIHCALTACTQWDSIQAWKPLLFPKKNIAA